MCDAGAPTEAGRSSVHAWPRDRMGSGPSEVLVPRGSAAPRADPQLQWGQCCPEWGAEPYSPPRPGGLGTTLPLRPGDPRSCHELLHPQACTGHGVQPTATLKQPHFSLGNVTFWVPLGQAKAPSSPHSPSSPSPPHHHRSGNAPRTPHASLLLLDAAALPGVCLTRFLGCSAHHS